jgi:hypothetical protein
MTRTYALVLVPVEKVKPGEVAIDRFDAWNILTALRTSKPGPPSYWYPKMRDTYNNLVPLFNETFGWEEEPQ